MSKKVIEIELPYKAIINICSQISPSLFSFPYQPTISFAGIPIKKEPMRPRHVAIWVKAPKAPRTAGGETYKCKWQVKKKKPLLKNIMISNCRETKLLISSNIPQPHKELQQVGQVPFQYQQITFPEACPTEFLLLHCKSCE